MKIDTRSRGFGIDDDLLVLVNLRFHFALDWVGSHVRRVTVYLSDENGPRGGVDKLCRAVVELWGGSTLVVEDRDSSMRVATDRAADRVGAAVRRALQRARVVRGRGPDVQN